MKKSRIILLTIVILVAFSSIVYAADTSLSWDNIISQYLGTYSDGKLDTSDAILTGKIPRILLTCFIVIAGVMLALGELPSAAATAFRMLLACAVVGHLGMYFGSMFTMPEIHQIAVAPPDPNPTSGNFISAFMQYFIYMCQQGAVNIYPICTGLVVVLWAGDLVLCYMFKLEDDIIKYLISNAIKMAFFIFLLSNWVTGLGIAHAVYASFEKIGYIAGGGTNTILMPDDIVGNTLKIISTTYDSLSQISIIHTPLAFFPGIIIFLVILAAITVIAIQIFMTRVEFWVMAVMVMPCISLGIFKHFRFLLEKAIGGVFNIAIKVGVVAFISAITAPILTKSVENFANSNFDLTKDFTALFTLLLSTIMISLLVWKVPNLAQALMTGQPSLVGGDMYAAAKVPATKAMVAKGTWDAASRMPGGNSARGAAGFLANMKSIGMQAGQGDLKGAATTGLKYGMGTLGTAKNMAKIGVQGGILDTYYRAQQEAIKNREIVSVMKAQKNAGKLENNSSPDLINNQKNEALRDSINKNLSPKAHYEYEKERAWNEKSQGKLISPEHTTPLTYTSLSEHNDDDNSD